MFASATFWAMALCIFVAGGAVGWVVSRLKDPAEKQRRELERLLAESQAALFAYREQVTRHFQGTAEKVNQLTEDYRELHRHLSEGAIDLCRAGTPGEDIPLLTSLSGSGYRAAPVREGESVAAPLDYAPKRAATPGVLSEDYDLEPLRGD